MATTAAPYGYVSSKDAYSGPDPERVRFQLQLIQSCYKDWGPTEFSKRAFWILRKNPEEGEQDILPTNNRFWNRRLIPFVHNRIQIDLDQNIIVANSSRNIMLKPRQAGYTTWSIIMRLLLPALLSPGTGCMLISQNSEYAAAHFDILKRASRYFFVADPFDGGHPDNEWAESLRKHLLHVAYSNRRELIFDQIDSRVRCASAEVEEVGQGLCCHPETWIETADRKMIRYKKLMPGMYVRGSDGEKKRIKKVYEIPASKHPYGGKAVRVRVQGVSNPFSAVVAPNHPFLTQRGLVEAKSLEKTDFIAYAYPRLEALEITRAEFVQDHIGKCIEETPLDRDFGLLCGMYLADGTLGYDSKRNTMRSFGICMMANRRKIDYALSRILNRLSLVISNEPSMGKKWLTVNSAGLGKWIEANMGHGKKKHVPIWWRRASKEFLFGMLEGWLCGDGWWHRKGIEATGKNEKLILTFRDISAAIEIGLPNFGMDNRRTVRTEICGVSCMNRGREYTLSLGGVLWERFCKRAGIKYNLKTHLRKKQQYYDGGKVYLPVYGTKNTRCKKFLDITVDSKDHLYRLPLGLTHNTIQHLTATEVSRWEGNPEETMANVKEAIPQDGTLDIECTPNGAGGYFFEEWQRATNPGSSKREFKPHFHTWWWHEEYRRSPGIETVDMTNEERDLVMANALDGEQIAWRREKKEALRHNFAEKYPENPVACFIVVGNMFFEKLTLLERYQELAAYEPAKTFNKFVIFKNSIKHRRYIIGADPAMGLPVTSENPDYSAAVVIDLESGEEMAAYRAHVLPDQFGDDLVEMAKVFNNAEIVVERNFEGGTVLEQITKQNMYGNIYYHKDWYRRDALQQQKSVKEMPGFPTNQRTRPMSLNRVRQFVKDCPDLIYDKIFIGEAMTFVYNDKGKPEAISGAHDDTVLCRAFAYYVRNIRLGLFLPEAVKQRERYGETPIELQEPEEKLQ